MGDTVASHHTSSIILEHVQVIELQSVVYTVMIDSVRVTGTTALGL